MSSGSLKYYEAKVSSASAGYISYTAVPYYKIEFDIPEFADRTLPRQIDLYPTCFGDQKIIEWLFEKVFGCGTFVAETIGNIEGRMVTVGLNDDDKVREINGLNFDEVYAYNDDTPCDTSSLWGRFVSIGENPSLCTLLSSLDNMRNDFLLEYRLPPTMTIKRSPQLDEK